MNRLMPVAQAQALILARVAPLGAQQVAVADATGRILADDITAGWDLPQRPVSMMDGYAVRASDVRTGVSLPLVGESAAGHPSDAPLSPGHCARISTGAVLPQDADAVVPQEDTRKDGAAITFTSATVAGTFVRAQGSDLGRGDVALGAGTRLEPSDLAVAVSTGHARVAVHRRPRVAIVSTGDELVPVGSKPAPGQIVSSNGIMLAAMVEAAGATAVDLGDAPDDPGALRDALARGLDAEVLVTSGGISVGDHDLVAPTLEDLGCAFEVQGVALRPGKPSAFGVAKKTLVFALPGNPASSLVAFALLVRPALRRLSGVRGSPFLPDRTVVLTDVARGFATRAHYVRAQLDTSGTRATPLRAQLSGHLQSIRDFDALVEVPAGTGDLAAGTEARALIVDPWWAERRPS